MNRIWGVFLFCFFALSCSRTDIAFRFADTFVAYELKDQFEFKGEQKDQAEKISQKIVQTVKVHFLPLLVEGLETARQEFLDLKDTEPKTYQDWLTQKFNYLRQIIEKQYLLLSPHMVELAKLANEKNWQAYQNNFEEKNKEILDEGKRPSRTKKNIESFFGDLTQEQEVLIENYLKKFSPDAQMRVDNRRHTINEFSRRLEKPFSNERYQQVMKEWMVDPTLWGSPKAKVKFDERNKALIELLAQLLAQRTEKQHQHLLREVDKYIRDLKKVIAQAQLEEKK